MLVFAAGVGLFPLSILFWAISRKWKAFELHGKITFWLGSLSLIVSFGCLLALFIKDQFHYEYVYWHGEKATALQYKIAGVWTAQEGSFLLWAVSAAIFGLLTLPGAGIYRRWMTMTYAAFLAALCGILAYESPFTLLDGVVAHGKVLMPETGNGMTPALQNYWVVIHPPIIFLGFGALTVMFAYAVAAMVTGNLVDWVRQVRPWAILTVAILGLGLCLGGIWAYETQGWGGFWAWDPVENVSLVPWLFLAAFVHGIIVQVTKKRWFGSNLWLAALPFLSFVYGTFLTRSGLLDKVSVHSFASMDRSALVILRGSLIATIVFFVGVFLFKGIKAIRATAPNQPEVDGVTREGFYKFGAILISLLSVCVAVGMSWPWISALLRGGEVARVEEGLYHQVVVWYFIPIMFAMAVGPFVGWKASGWGEVVSRVANVFIITIGLLGFALMGLSFLGIRGAEGATIPFPFGLKVPLLPWMIVLLGICMFVMVANVWRAAELFKRSKMSLGGFVSHFGLAMLLAGLILSRGFELKEDGIVQQGRPARLLGYGIAFKDFEGKSLRDRDNKAVFEIIEPSGRVFQAKPTLYFFSQGEEDQAMVWPHIERSASHDVYLALGSPVVDVWNDPVNIRPGETKTQGGVTLKYEQFTRDGEAGETGTRFGAVLKVSYEGHSHTVNPTLELGPTGMIPTMPQVGPDFRVMLTGFDAGSKSVGVRLLFAQAVYPVTLFYKPMTIFVWVGTGILTLGGLIAAVYRRVGKKGKLSVVPADEAQDQPKEKIDDATLTVA